HMMARRTAETTRVLIPLYRAEQRKAEGDQAAANRLVAEALTAARKAGAGQRSFLAATVYAHQENHSRAVKAFKRYLVAGGSRAGAAGLMLTLAPGGTRQPLTHTADVATQAQAFTFMLGCRAYAEAREHLDTLEQLAGQDWWAQQDRPWES